jgi:hypothetical protein
VALSSEDCKALMENKKKTTSLHHWTTVKKAMQLTHEGQRLTITNKKYSMITATTK